MLEHTFVHIPGIGRTTERALWARGVHTWQDADRLALHSPNVQPRAQAQLRRFLSDSHRALQEKNAGFFARLCELGEAWRVFSHFASECVYLDIETTGLSPGYDEISLVGLYDGQAYKAFIAGDTLDTLPDHLRGSRILITFNGAGFDLRFLQARFPQLALPPIHIDLRWVTKKLGLTGGLKAIEAALGLARNAAVQHLTGLDAVILWRQYLGGNRQALDRLIQYNTEDVVHLETILETCYVTLSTQLSAAWGLTLAPAPERPLLPVRIPRESTGSPDLSSF